MAVSHPAQFLRSLSGGFRSNGNLTEIRPPTGNRTTMLYDKENRLIWHKTGAVVNTMTYDGDGLKRNEIAGSGRTTLVWDGTDYLQARTL